VSKNERNLFDLRILNNGHKDIKRLQRAAGIPNIHGNKFWKSSLLLMDYLSTFPPLAIRPELRRKKTVLRVLEIGCGWGLAGIYCAKHFNAEVTSLDADETVFPYLMHHAELNGVELDVWQCRYEKIRKVDLQQYDVMIAADICFWDELVTPLFKLIRRAHQAGGIRVIIADPGRPTFSAVAELCVEKLGALCEPWSVPHPHNYRGWVLDMDPNYNG